jgi:hypothetical protein
MVGSSCIVVGFSFASSMGCKYLLFPNVSVPFEFRLFDVSGSHPLTLVLIVGGPCVLIIGGFYEIWTRRAALFPRTAFTDLTTSTL